MDAMLAKSCLTPAPVRSAESSWRWAYSSQTTTVSRDKYALSVPAGVIDEVGGWASITPIDRSITDTTPAGPLVTGDQPTADFHIYATWTGGGDTVTVQLPADPVLASNPDWVPFLIHTKADGSVETFHRGTAAWNQAAGIVSASQASLSETSSSSYAPSAPGEGPGRPVQDPNDRRELRHAVAQESGTADTTIPSGTTWPTWTATCSTCQAAHRYSGRIRSALPDQRRRQRQRRPSQAAQQHRLHRGGEADRRQHR